MDPEFRRAGFQVEECDAGLPLDQELGLEACRLRGKVWRRGRCVVAGQQLTGGRDDVATSGDLHVQLAAQHRDPVPQLLETNDGTAAVGRHDAVDPEVAGGGRRTVQPEERTGLPEEDPSCHLGRGFGGRHRRHGAQARSCKKRAIGAVAQIPNLPGVRVV
jgi:hypothetical protein